MRLQDKVLKYLVRLCCFVFNMYFSLKVMLLDSDDGFVFFFLYVKIVRRCNCNYRERDKELI